MGYAAGRYEEALAAALAWYKKTAGGDIAGLVDAYHQPPRRIPDRRGGRGVPSSSVFALGGPCACSLEDAPGPATARAMLRRLFSALGPQHELVGQARAKLEFLLDRKPWVPFHTRFIRIRRGGPPRVGKGTGSRSGYSRLYWALWDSGRNRRNN